SGALAKQIAQGAPADLFISANPKWMNYLVEEQLVSAAEVTPFVGNALVLVGQKGQPVTTLEEALKLSRIAIASPRSAPAGKYVEQALHSAGLTERFAAKLVMSKDVRQALMYADTGEVEGAFIYRTDALLASNAVILFEVPQTLYPLVSYPLALTRQGETNPEALAFADFLKGAKAATILRRYGFSLP
ncbi:MAG: molybdate ABC transporter substrate-binding protein, partial [Desulfuromonas sp.]